MAERSEREVRVLSIDGGGIRGIIPARILQYVADHTQRPIWESFDLIAGTSTGGILAVGLGTAAKVDNGTSRPYTPAELAELYVARGGEIFHKPWLCGLRRLFGPKYSPVALEGILNQYFGSARLSGALLPLLVASYDVAQQQPFFFKSHRIAAEPGYDWEVKQVARATSAAPTFFPPLPLWATVAGKAESYVLVDGGVYANNPAVAAYAEARRLHLHAEKFFVLSIGTGSRTDGLTYKQTRRWGLLGWATHISSIFMDSVSGATDYEMDTILGSNHERLQLELTPDSVEMDDASPANIARLEAQAESFISKNQKQLDRICARLR